MITLEVFGVLGVMCLFLGGIGWHAIRLLVDKDTSAPAAMETTPRRPAAGAEATPFEYETVGYPAGLRHRYGTPLSNEPAPFEQHLGLTPIPQNPPAAGMVAGEIPAQPRVSGHETPAAGAVPAGTPRGPGPDGLPEGDEPAARPPQETTRPGNLPQVWADRNAGRFDSALGSPANGHALASTGESAVGLPTLAPKAITGRVVYHPEPASQVAQNAAAAAAVKALPADDYLGQLEDATAYTDLPPLRGLLSDDTIARGIPAVK